MTDPTLLIGVGQYHRGDDEAGLKVAQSVAEKDIPNLEVVIHTGDGTGLMTLWEGRETVVVVDAALSGAAPGTLHSFEAIETPLPTGFFRYSTHAFALAEAVETSRRLGTLPRSLTIHAIEGTAYAQGAAMTDPVAQACDRLIADLQAAF